MVLCLLIGIMIKVYVLTALVVATTTYGDLLRDTSPSVIKHSNRMETPFEAVHLTPSLTACFNWRGFDNQVINFFHDPHNNVTINGVLNTNNRHSRSSFDQDQLLYITRLFIRLAKYNLEIMINPNVAYVRQIGHTETVLQLPLQDTESYLANHKEVRFQLIDISTERSTLVIKFSKKTPRHLVPSGMNAFNHMTLSIPKREKFSAQSSGVWGYIRKSARELNKWLHIKDDKMKKNASSNINFNDTWIPITKNKIQISYADKYMDCWYVSDPSLLVGTSLDQFKVNSITDVPPVVLSK